MTGTDPAIEAARRALEPYGDRDHPELVKAAEIAAREALKPIRDLHCRVPICMDADECTDPNHADNHTESVDGWTVCPDCSPIGWTCGECAEIAEYDDEPPEWPCATAKLIYTTTELENPDD